MDTVKELFAIFRKLGIDIHEEDKSKLINDYITNSYTQVKFVIEAEKKFNIEFPERLMIAVDDITVKAFADEIEKLSDLKQK